MSSIYNNYFLSNKIKVFPCAYRNSTYDASARLNTEYNFTHLPHMVDKASYIIKFNDKSKSEPEAKLICVIQGYYFEIELGTGDYTTLQNKYLNICVASPSSSNGENFIEGPHLCSWNSNNIEAGLDLIQATSSSSVYIFTGLQISELTKENPSGTLSREGYQCYALKLDASARLPISASKIDNNAGTPISTSFTTGALNVAGGKFTVDLSKSSITITANAPVTINNTLDVKTGTTTTSILTANSTGVTINKPTTVNNTLDVKTGTTSILKAESTREGKKVTINGTTTIKGTTKIQNSSSGVNDGNLTVAGTGSFGDKLTVTTGGASIKGDTTIDGITAIKGKTTIGTDTNTKTVIDNDTVTTSKIIAGNLVIDKNATNDNKILEIKNKAGNEVIFSVNISSGKTFAKEIDADKINATVEGESKNAVDAKNVTDTIKGKAITSIFESNGLVAQKASSLTAASSTNSAGNVIVVGNTNGTTDALLPKNDSGRTYNIGSSTQVFDNIYAWTFHGNASTADSFSSATTVELTGNITGTSAVSTKGWTVYTTIAEGAVTKTMISDGAVTNNKLAGNIENGKLANSSIKIGSKSVVALGSSIGTQDTPFKGDLYFGKQKSGNENDCSIIITGQYTKRDTEYPLKILDYNGNTLIQFTNNYGVFNTTSVPKQIIYAATDSDKTKGKTELFGDKICIYAQGRDGLGGTIKAGMVDLSAHESNSGLWIRNIKQIHVNNASLKSSSLVRVNTNKVYLGSTNYGAAIDSTETDATFIINSAKTSGDMLQIKRLLDGGANVKKVFSVDYDGNVTANTYNAKSDRRLKENIIDYKPEKSILDLPVKKFDFIDGPKNQIGCIAQDLKEICPEIVNENEKGYLSIQESKLVYLLLDEVKKLKNEVEELKRK